MRCKKTVMLSLLGSIALSGCSSSVSRLPSPPSLPPVGQNMQERMEELLQMPSSTTPPPARSTAPNVLDSNHL